MTVKVCGWTGALIPDKGYEWDTGIHYVGNSINADSGSSTGKVLEFLTDGKLKWERMGDLIDVIKLKANGSLKYTAQILKYTVIG